MLQDRYGLDLSTTSAKARDAYVEGIDHFLAANIGVETALEAAIAEDEGFVLAHLAIARNKQIMGDGRGARGLLAKAREIERDLSARETALNNSVIVFFLMGKSKMGSIGTTTLCVFAK